MGPQGIAIVKKAKTQNSLGKLMATVILDMEGILLTEYMKK
jgi:hypothetical protein